ncbi:MULTISPECIES: DUF2730 family protein [unclassified Marinimicrobium]|jgi:hypothetical protein|uniref:DUF2730 family protein n=1 Tax=unclassified Marinimicrobium TaxID=2632100 RepID=UPI000C4A83CC|nr:MULTISPECIES: DUF2730 family protein [unclassified Marinimicrobium]MAN51202.1 hypothetical protein [Marinimicrobium sp.]|tara:strand:+ start:119 stop:421 length:303 start_codon:yes stop_codon:yes gene_type:complete
MSLDDIEFSWGFLAWLITACCAVFAWWTARSKADGAEQIKMEQRVATLESRINDVPSQATIAKLYGKLDRLEGELGSFIREFQGLTAAVNRMNDYLLNNK